MSAEQVTRYHALLKIADQACANAVATGADKRAEFWETLAVALDDDCPQQASAALRLAATLRLADAARLEVLTLIHPEG